VKNCKKQTTLGDLEREPWPFYEI